MLSSKNNNILSDKSDLNDFMRFAIIILLLLKIVVIKNIRDSLIERELFIISLSAIVNINKNLFIFANIEFLLTRKLKDAKKTSLVNNTLLDINLLDLVILSRSILIIE